MLAILPSVALWSDCSCLAHHRSASRSARRNDRAAQYELVISQKSASKSSRQGQDPIAKIETVSISSHRCLCLDALDGTTPHPKGFAVLQIPTP
jgi:hypothetical protein